MRRLPQSFLARCLLASILGFCLHPQANAQLPPCQPPANDEYLLLTVTPNSDVQARVYAVLPVSFKPSSCNYLGETVLRIGGFATQEAADTWATYIAKQASTPAFVARPPAAGQPSTLPPLPVVPPQPGTTLPGGSSPIPQPTQPTNPIQPTVPSPGVPSPGIPTTGNGYNPQILGNGYAVLVNYYNRPETATQVRQVADREIGLVSYGQRPYLLATFSTDAAAANNLLQRLSDKGLAAMVVDGRRVVLLKSAVR